MNLKRIRVKDGLIFLTVFLTMLISGTAVYSVEQFTGLRNATLLALFAVLFITFMVTMNCIGKIKKQYG